MAEELSLDLFRRQIRRLVVDGEMYFSVVDSVAVLTDSKNPRQNWFSLKKRLIAEGAQGTISELRTFKLPGQDGKLRDTDTATRQTLLRIIQSMESPKAEPFKVAIAALAEERIEEIENPEAALEQLTAYYQAQNYGLDWISARINTIITRNKVTDEWIYRGAHEGPEFAILTNTIHRGTFGLSVKEHHDRKGLPGKIDLRDHMSIAELSVLAFAEGMAAQLHQDRNSQGFAALERDARDGGRAGARARKLAEEMLGRPVVTSENFLPPPGQGRRRVTRPKKGQDGPKLLE